jgi:8-oxo-dGTP diphosphatase
MEAAHSAVLSVSFPGWVLWPTMPTASEESVRLPAPRLTLSTPIPMQEPVFGMRLPAREYRSRPSAYALVTRDDGLIAVVRSPSGVYLPGGGIEPGESPEECVIREGREEAGLILQPGEVLGCALEWTDRPGEATGAEKQCTFLRATVVGAAPATEPQYELRWIPAREGAMVLTFPSHRWVVCRRLSAAEKLGGWSERRGDAWRRRPA